MRWGPYQSPQLTAHLWRLQSEYGCHEHARICYEILWSHHLNVWIIRWWFFICIWIIRWWIDLCWECGLFRSRPKDNMWLYGLHGLHRLHSLPKHNWCLKHRICLCFHFHSTPHSTTEHACKASKHCAESNSKRNPKI